MAVTNIREQAEHVYSFAVEHRNDKRRRWDIVADKWDANCIGDAIASAPTKIRTNGGARRYIDAEVHAAFREGRDYIFGNGGEDLRDAALHEQLQEDAERDAEREADDNELAYNFDFDATWTVDQLRDLAKQREVKGAWGMNKAELLEGLVGHDVNSCEDMENCPAH